MRAGEMTRIGAFVDAAFAFALTLLVISVGVIPDSMPKLVDALKGIPAFAASFAQIATFWYAHMSWSRRYGLDDFTSVLLSLLLVFLVMVYVYPLKALFATFFGWISNGQLPMGFALNSTTDLRVMFVVYGVLFATMSLVISLLYVHAWRQRNALQLTPDEGVAVCVQIARRFLPVLVALLSIVVALVLPQRGPDWVFSMPGWVYALLFLSGPFTAWVGRRVRAHFLAAPAT